MQHQPILASPMDNPHTYLPSWLDYLESLVAKIVALAGGLWAIWKVARASGKRIRAFIVLVGRFANSVDALQELNANLVLLRNTVEIYNELRPEPFWKTDAAGNCTHANSSFLRLVGLPLTDVQGNNWEQVLAPADAEWVVDEFREAVTSGAVFSRDFGILSGGKLVRVRARHLPIKDSQGKVLEYHGSWSVLE